MSLHRLDLPTLTIITAWKKYVEHRDTDRLKAVMALVKHFERVDEYAVAKNMPGFNRCDLLDHTARGKVR